MARIAIYIDGYNLYYGVRALGDKHGRCFKWLDLAALAKLLVINNPLASAGDHLVILKYFSAPIRGNPAKERRQAIYFSALATVGIMPIKGFFNTS